VITKLLSTAVKLYLRSHCRQVEDLQVKISGTNRQIIKGYIPDVFLSCQRAVYQGLHLRSIELKGNDIAINLPEVIKKKPLQLLKPILVTVKLVLGADDLCASLNSTLLQSGLRDLWQIILAAETVTVMNSKLTDSDLEWQNIAIANQQLILVANYNDQTGKKQELKISTGISLTNSHTLCLFPLTINSESSNIAQLPDNLAIDLGTDVNLQQLVVESEQILCLGKITIRS
jgi:LmeA-like phospholipid-binding